MLNGLKKLRAEFVQRHVHAGQALAAKVEQHRNAFNLAGAALGLAMLSFAAVDTANAQLTARYNEVRISNAVNVIFTYIEGSFGALVMVCAGVGAILSSAFGQYRASLGLLVVALGSFTLRSFVGTFFNDKTLHG